MLHRLRHVMGDQNFFNALKHYRTRYALSNASIADFQHECEGVYGASLDWFFKQWIYAPGTSGLQTLIEISSVDATGHYAVTLGVKQKQSREIPVRENGNYTMPLDVTIHYSDSTSETRMALNDTRKQRFTFNVSKQPVESVSTNLIGS